MPNAENKRASLNIFVCLLRLPTKYESLAKQNNIKSGRILKFMALAEV